ncbi:alpha-1,4-glucan--maltose-1-phosphate maltosyltransferase [Robertkochia sediminum]|uniref:alpha-1,4-glucan--maltose-1-phosphate maltosyltransferase n=1 Tax=Robertkochia sediminum TaxID=2785326 RepID=UPI0019334E40|nr:alpha-1,4-glucan--maltose-1-phosphate maltosyltransferase [Robertkochia sediminum]MBL7473622.1 alpha-1,4-glucan--maltose-1-phosphate maltosyltransferase [Robertkochia sediminum]
MQDQSRVIIENVHPQIHHGDFYIKRVVGEHVDISADVFADGHDVVACVVRFKHEKERNWRECRMEQGINDHWSGTFSVEKQGEYMFYIQGWVDYALNWQHGIGRKIEDGQMVKSELLEGIEYIDQVLRKCQKSEQDYLRSLKGLFAEEFSYEKAIEEAVSLKLKELFIKYPMRYLAADSPKFRVYTDRTKARFSTWYEFFPRSASAEAGKHGTFEDCERLIPRIAEMGFDVLYFPPIHPIGEVNRKGKNNATTAEPGDVGSPWGIGSAKGGHKSIHPELGTEKDFKSLVSKAREYGIEIAMDFALQCAPDHPYVKEHPEWFKWRPDGTVQYAENPPKKYQDILPIYFETKDWKRLWKELLSIAMYWVEEFDIRIFRVDNPHTKPFKFWGWLIAEVKKKYPDVLFLSEAFTRPKVMEELAKQGFTQSYTYFTWRNSKQELVQYLEELTKTERKDYFRPNFWPNTPDINPYPLQGGNEAVFLQRYFLAATLSSNTGVYGPVYEHLVSAAVPGKEEYLNSEKYEVSHWNWDLKNKLTHIMTKINMARKEQLSLQQTNNIRFCDTDNDQLLAWYKFDDDRTNETFMVASLDAFYSKQGWVRLPLDALRVKEGQQIRMLDLITGSSYIWDKEWNYVELHPALPFHLFKIIK